ncbi:hypothetical protein CPC08DRAFT_358044 [Agrocybe pediades]|nr:hypothetical protein CPC08DRAFT_358044 [Agrocybe pediades]
MGLTLISEVKGLSSNIPIASLCLDTIIERSLRLYIFGFPIEHTFLACLFREQVSNTPQYSTVTIIIYLLLVPTEMSAPSSYSPPGHVDYDPYGLSPVQVTVKENDEVVPAVRTPKEPSIKQEEEDGTDCCKKEEATPSDDSIKAFVADISGLGRDLECLTDEFISLGSYQTVTGQRSSSYSASPEAITSRSPHQIDQLYSPASANSAAGNVFQRSNNPSPEPRPVAPEYQADSDWYMIMPTPTGDNPSAPATESSTQAGWLYTPDEEPRVAFPQGANVPLAQGYASQAANWRTANEEPVSPGPWSNRRGPVTPPISYLHLHRHPTSIWRRPLCNNQASLARVQQETSMAQVQVDPGVAEYPQPAGVPNLPGGPTP